MDTFSIACLVSDVLQARTGLKVLVKNGYDDEEFRVELYAKDIFWSSL